MALEQRLPIEARSQLPQRPDGLDSLRQEEVAPEVIERLQNELAQALDVFEKQKAKLEVSPEHQALGEALDSAGHAALGGDPRLAEEAALRLARAAGLARQHGDIINRGIDRVLVSQRADGMLAHEGKMYGHSAATLMLAEVTGMLDPLRQERVDLAFGKAVKLILDAQQVRKSPQNPGGWRYEPNSTDSDMSLSGWAFMVLWAARNSGYAPNLYEALLARQQPNGSFQRDGDSGQAYATAMAILSLTPTFRQLPVYQR